MRNTLNELIKRKNELEQNLVKLRRQSEADLVLHAFRNRHKKLVIKYSNELSNIKKRIAIEKGIKE
ncbi:hypothetical protein [Aureibacter tunicatorum]|uniref:Uncharacterized protein n=1 Tax=Aureibacter tunicatorum TaxID=866807 RepID=A0AAE4BT33_9BACT|nr:hypothetical protein [Aureibacter tunicatorum]MDR6239082.1 hypothetical protein [Aureibacter tunicatorum]BDD04992.1 hypothetical protein AUTU_24750 [Aureibacter tunicatorum]